MERNTTVALSPNLGPTAARLLAQVERAGAKGLPRGVYRPKDEFFALRDLEAQGLIAQGRDRAGRTAYFRA